MTSSEENLQHEVCCPYCLGALAWTAEGAWCTGCDQRFARHFGLLCLARAPQSDPGELGGERLGQFFREAQEGSWDAALKRSVSSLPHPSRFLEEAISPCPGSWWPLSAVERPGSVLLLGCDWGAAACVLAARAAAVFACDLNLATLRFAAVRAAAQNIGNLNLLCAGDTPRLPFGNQRFHMVAVSPNWPRMLAGQSGVSRILLHNLLQEIGRVLVPEGQVLVVAGNPWSRQRWRQLRGPGLSSHRASRSSGNAPALL
jgi:SAM-dependent methyltransferase